MIKSVIYPVLVVIITSVIVYGAVFVIDTKTTAARHEEKISNNERAIIAIGELRKEIAALNITVTRIAEKLNVRVERPNR